MLKHIVMYKLKDNSAQAKKKLVDTFMSMKGKIKVLKGIESGADVLFSERSFDVALICTFDNINDLDVYQNDPIHLEVKKYVHSVKESAYSVDFEY